MRYLFGFLCVCALVALPLSVSAQAGEEGATSEPSAQEPAPSSEPTPEEPAQPTQPTPSRLERGHLDPFAEPEDFVPPLQPASEPALKLEVDSTALEVTPSPSGTEDGYTLEEMEGAVERHRRGLIISSVFFGVGVGALAGSIAWGPHAECGDDDTWFCIPPGPMFVGTFGGAMAIGGLVGMALKGTRLNKSRSELRKLKEARYERPPRVQWDLAQSRLVF